MDGYGNIPSGFRGVLRNLKNPIITDLLNTKEIFLKDTIEGFYEDAYGYGVMVL